MSQLWRQGSNNNTTTTEYPPASPSPKHQASLQSPLTGDLIPRDYLGLRLDGQALPSGAVAIASSPLHTTTANTQTQSHSQSNPSPLQSPVSPRSPVHASTSQSRPSINRIAHAAFPTPPSATGQVLSGASAKGSSLNRPDQNDRGMNGRISENKSRLPSNTPESTTSSPISPVNSLQSMSGERPGQRVMPRTSSIDSAISSLSSASQPNKSSFDANTLSQSDIGNLISTAGSAEAVIIHLLKEKHHAASQNSQLWRLVDKQRTLILGLNKDLEHALKEKDRYKRKAKELQSSAPPVPSRNEHAVQYGATKSGGAPVSQGTSGPLQTQGQAVQPKIPKTSTGEPRSNLQHVPITGDHQSPSIVGSSRSLDVSEASADMTKESSTMGRPEEQNQTPQSLVFSRQELATASPSSLASSSSAINDTPPVADRQQRVPHPIRKPPPAPLDLGQPNRTPCPDDYNSESEYEDVLSVDELPIERGRRKTRDDDDREREAALDKQKETSIGSGNENPQALKVSESSRKNPASAESIGPQAATLAEQSGPLTSSFSSRMAHDSSISGHSLIMSSKSPGLPLSPRPEDRPLGSPLPRMPRDMSNPLASLPMSPGSNLSGLALSPRAGTYPNPFVPGPSTTSMSTDSGDRSVPSIDAAVQIDSPRAQMSKTQGIYQGLMSEDYPGLLLSPNALPLVQVKVSSSRLRPSRNSYMASRPSEEEPVFTLSVFSRSENAELWRVEKIIAALPQLDQQIRHLCAFGGRLPDRSIFSGHSPAKVDVRRAALNSYFEALLDTPMDEKAALVICQFLTSDAIEPRDDETSLLKGGHEAGSEMLRGPDGKPRKEGYLTKRGKNFGGWKARYFVLHGPELKYFESPGGPHLGTIKIHSAQIGKQSQGTNGQNTSPSGVEDDSDNQYRHAFLILEPKKKDSSALVRHVLCSESDDERDAWVEALLEHVEGPSENEGPHSGSSKGPENQTPTATSNPKALSSGSNKSNKALDNPDMQGPDTVQGFSYDDAIPAEPPVFGPPSDQHGPKSPVSPPGLGLSTDSGDIHQVTNPLSDHGQVSSKVISRPTNGAIIQDAGAWGNKAATSTKEKKRSIWGFRTRSSIDLASQLQASYDSPTAQTHNNVLGDRRDFIRPVFGIPLTEAVQFCGPQGVDVDLPAVVYRCVEYLNAKGAASEEGIFRLSGSNVVVKALKERFNTEGDVDFLADDQYYDVHAIASLFKQYLRELPTTVLTRELHLDFLRVLELDEKQKKIVAFNYLVHSLPGPNLALLRALVQFLINIVNNSDVNKMTVRNVGIVFAPTLNIPAPVFSMFLTEYDGIFENHPGSGADTMELTVDDHSASPDEVRSPRRQMFSDIPTPGYNQTSFRKHGEPQNEPGMHHDTGFISMQPSYEPPSDNIPESFDEDETYSPAMNTMLTPNNESLRSAKAKRRESSLLFMDLNASTPATHNDRV